MGKYLILFTFLMSYSMYFLSDAKYNTALTDTISCFNVVGDPVVKPEDNLPAGACKIAGFNLFNDLTGILAVVAGVGLAGAVIAGSVKFPDPYTLFGVAGLMLFYLASFPIDILVAPGEAMPVEVRILVGGYFVIAYIISFFEFYYKGSL